MGCITFDLERKRKHIPTNLNSDALIPGEPVLDQFIKPAQETIGVGLLKKMGWKPGQGIGPKLTRSRKKQSSRATKRLFGPALPSDSRRGAVCYLTNFEYF